MSFRAMDHGREDPPLRAQVIAIGAVEAFAQGLSPQTALLAGKMEPLSESSAAATASAVEAMCGTTSSTPLVALLQLGKYGLWRGGRGRCADDSYMPRSSEVTLLRDEATVDGVWVRDGMGTWAAPAPPASVGKLAVLR